MKELLKKWMDEKNLSMNQAAESLGIEIQTLRNWRSAGVPERRSEQVRLLIQNWGKPATLGRPNQRLTLEINAEEYDLWEECAQAAGKTLRNWCLDGLNEMAKLSKQELENLSKEAGCTLKVAEEQKPYPKKRAEGA